MSTILHPVQHHVRWYAVAAAALATGLLILLMATVFGRSEPTEVPSPPTEVQTLKHYDGRAYAPPCFAGHPGNPIELAHSGCPVGLP